MMHNTELARLANDFFREFARAEYALKAAGFHEGDGDAKPNWDSFADAVQHLVAAPPTKDLEAAIKFILDAPPKKQVISHGKIMWEVRAPTGTTARNLFVYVRRIRNNLFHGGKFNGHWFDPERSEPLIESSLVILRAAVAAHPDVSSAYHS